MGGIGETVLRRKIQTWPQIKRDGYASVRPRRKSAYGPRSAANNLTDIGSAAKRRLDRTSSISSVCAAAWSSRLMEDSTLFGWKQTPCAPHGLKAKDFGSCVFGITKCWATRTASLKRFGKPFGSRASPAEAPIIELIVDSLLPPRTRDCHPLPTLPHQGGGIRMRTCAQLWSAQR